LRAQIACLVGGLYVTPPPLSMKPGAANWGLLPLGYRLE